MKYHRHILLSLIVIFIVNSLIVLLDKPPIWPDEAIYFNIADNFINHGKLATDLWGGLKPGADQYAAWNPPVFFLTLSVWLFIFGFSIISERLLSVTLGVGIVWLTYQLTRKLILSKNQLINFLPVFGLVIDFHFVRGARLSRPEIEALFFILISLYLAQVTANPKTHSFKLSKPMAWPFIYQLLSGVVMGLAVLVHPIVLFFTPLPPLQWSLSQNRQLLHNTLYYLVGLLSPITIWLLAIYNYWQTIWTQMTLAATRKSLETPWIIEVFKDKNIWLQTIFLLMIIISFLYLRHLKTNHRPQQIFLGVLLLIGWVVSIFGRQLWYTIYLLPFLYIIIADLLSNHTNYRQNKSTPIIICLLLFINIFYSIITIINVKSHHLSYQQFSEKIQQAIPTGSTIFLSSIPDPYFSLINPKYHYTIYEFPDYPAPTDQYTQLLNQVDYIVYTGSQEQVVFGNLLANYLSFNTDQVISIGRIGEYQAQVIKLVPQTQRRLLSE